jgi:hypothetical protein
VAKSVAAVLAVVAALASLGCAPLRTARECEKLSNLVKAGLRDLQNATSPRTPAAYRAAGALYRKVADQLRLTAGSSQLRSVAEDYARSVEAMGPPVKTYADALESGDAQRIEAAHAEVERASRREQMASRRLGIECQGRF